MYWGGRLFGKAVGAFACWLLACHVGGRPAFYISSWILFVVFFLRLFVGSLVLMLAAWVFIMFFGCWALVFMLVVKMISDLNLVCFLRLSLVLFLRRKLCDDILPLVSLMGAKVGSQVFDFLEILTNLVLEDRGNQSISHTGMTIIRCVKAIQSYNEFWIACQW